MTSKRVTIADVARAAGVSPGTVSRVINRRAGTVKISDATRHLVLETADRLGYSPNPFATALRTQRTGVIGAIVRDVGDPFLSMLLREIQHAARQEGVDVLFGHAEYDLQVVGRHLAFMHSHLFDGLLLLGDIQGDQAIIAELIKSNTPFVTVARGESTSFPLVNIDELAGTHLALDYLYGLDHRRIAFVGNLEHGGVSERLKFFRDFLHEKDLDACSAYIQTCANSRSAALQCAQQLLRLSAPPTAIFCATDLAALGVINGLLRAGWNVPAEMSVVGFDDIEGTADTSPALTTVRQPAGEMAERAVRLLMRLIEGAPLDDGEMRAVIQPKLIVRDSCAAPRHN
ncbi:MAG: LacI family DNA-binding transcriptional regulator [Anaerolineae bacterium]|nr:LacI family DNA-binding transcriptional regulator [Anaerolineae bacterium]